METHTRNIYLREIINQSECYLIAINILEDSLKILPSNTKVVFYALQSALSHAANISKIIWEFQNRKSNRDFRKERTSYLQSILHLSDSSPLASTSMRNNLDHFDDRLDTWATTDANNKIIVDMNLGRKGSIVIDDGHHTAFLRNFDPNSRVMTFFDQEVGISDLTSEVLKVRKRANDILRD